jgi:hypothetical protein
MKKISYWARSHKWVARILIVVSFLLLNILGIITGKLLCDINTSLPDYVLLIAAGIYGTFLISYPGKKGLSNYIKQKTCDFLLAASVYTMFVYMGNNALLIYIHPVSNSAFANTSSAPADSVKKDYKPIKEFSASLKDAKGNFLKWRERKMFLKYQVKEIKKDNSLSTGAKVLLIVLSVAATLGLLYLVTALSCSLSCSGSDGLAALVLLGGLSLSIVLLIVLIRIILGVKKKKKRDNTSQHENE